jgi:hypothetical protein
MGHTTPLIQSVTTPAYMQVTIDASDGNRYTADLSSLAGVYCFPRDSAEWSKVSVDSYGLALVWACRFEVHVDQIIGLATRIEKIAATDVTLARHESHA